MTRLPKVLERWWRRWAIVDLVTLVAGAALSGAYIYHRSGHLESPIDELWLAIATDLLAVWLTVRFVDVVIERRTRRHGVRDSVTGNLNYLMRTAQALVPRFEGYQLIDIRNEVAFFTDKRRLQGALFSRSFSMAERAMVEAVFKDAAALAGLAAKAKRAIDEAQLIRSIASLWRDDSGVKDVDDALDAFYRNPEAFRSLLQGSLVAARARQLPSSSAEAFLRHVADYLEQVDASVVLTNQIVNQVGEFRRLTWGDS